jgi:hydrogenase maturation protease
MLVSPPEQTPRHPAFHLLIIGYGNSLRRDDGAGLLLAQALAAQGQAAGHTVDLITAHQLMPELALDIAESQATVVLFVDTFVATHADTLPNPTRGAASPTPDLTLVQNEEANATLGHHLTPATLLLYAAQLFAVHPRAWLLQTPGYDFDHGDSLSAAAQTALDSTLAVAADLWAQLYATDQL